MIAGRPAEILRQLEAPAVPDRELLSRFVRERDQAAFAELVRRHGPVVLCVCRRVTGHQQDAEDAFQAVFLLLARKAAAIAQPDLLGNWLYGVAVRIAQTARRTANRRRAREVVVSAMPDQAISRNDANAELNPIIDEELTALPSWYREAIVLCDLRGVSREEAAIALGVPEGTLSSRLANGRKKLAARLAKRGIALSVATVPTTLSATQAATVPAELFARTCTLVADWAAGGPVPKPLAKLTEGGMTMRKILLFGMLIAAVTASGVVYGTQSPEKTLPVDPQNPPAVAAKPETTTQPALETKPGDKSVTYTSKPRLQDSFDIELHGNLVVLWNMQGTRIAIRGKRYLGNLPGTPLPGGAQPNPPDTRREQAAVVVIPIPTIAAKELISPQVVWNINNKIHFVGSSPDGQYFLTELREYQLVSGQHKLGFWGDVKEPPGDFSANPSGQQKIVRSVNLDPTETQGYAFAADGKTFRTVGIERDPATQQISNLNVLEVDATTGQHLKKLLTVSSSTFALSSDGKRLAVKTESAVIIYDLDRAAKLSSYTLKEEVKLLPPAYLENGYQTWSEQQVHYLKFSPDGHRLIVCISPEKIGYHYGRPNVPNFANGSEISGPIGQTVVLNADTGEALPALEGAECLELKSLTGLHPFSHDGRLLALSGTRYDFKKAKVGTNQEERIVLDTTRHFLTVWDTQTGKVLKTWNNQSPQVAFNPARPLLAVLEPNGDETRLGFWDFSAEAAEKK